MPPTPPMTAPRWPRRGPSPTGSPDGKLRAAVPYVALDPSPGRPGGASSTRSATSRGAWFPGYDGLPEPPQGTPHPTTRRWRASMTVNSMASACAWSACCSRFSEPGMNGSGGNPAWPRPTWPARMARGLLLDTLWRMGFITDHPGPRLAVSAALRSGWSAPAHGGEERQPDDLSRRRWFRCRTSCARWRPLLNHFTERLPAVRTPGAVHHRRLHELRIAAGVHSRHPASNWACVSTEPRCGAAPLRRRRVYRPPHPSGQPAAVAGAYRACCPCRFRGRRRAVELAQLARELGMALAPLAHQRGIAWRWKRTPSVAARRADAAAS